MKEIIVGSNEAGQRLTKLLKKYLKEASDGFLYKMLRKKNITLNQKKAEGKEILKEGDCIRLYLSEETLEKFRGKENISASLSKKQLSDCNISNIEKEYYRAYSSLTGITIIFENKDILLLNKPVGILSQKSKINDISLNEWMIGYLLKSRQTSGKQLETFRPSVCNRLDRNTSGLVICGKTYPGTKQINTWIRNREVKKYYRCFMEGELKEALFLKGYLKKDNKENKVIIINTQKSGFSPIETYVNPLMKNHEFTYAEVELITGKTHQIRAHLSSIGHPLLGDVKYGSSFSDKATVRGNLRGQLLHSYRMVFPVSRDYPDISQKEFIAPEPEYFLSLKNKFNNK